jgi:hypothetical protein
MISITSGENAASEKFFIRDLPPEARNRSARYESTLSDQVNARARLLFRP